MSRVARSFSRSGVYHILFRGVNQQSIFEENSDYEKLKKIIKTVQADMGFTKILSELKTLYLARQLQRVTGVSRGVISKV